MLGLLSVKMVKKTHGPEGISQAQTVRTIIDARGMSTVGGLGFLLHPSMGSESAEKEEDGNLNRDWRTDSSGIAAVGTSGSAYIMGRIGKRIIPQPTAAFHTMEPVHPSVLRIPDGILVWVLSR